MSFGNILAITSAWAVVTASIVAIVTGYGAPAAVAANANDFNPGRIIDDEIFYDKTAMGSANAVQKFIEDHTPACDTWGTSPSGYGNLTRAQYAVQIKGWHGPPYVCLQNYHENPNTGETSFEKGGGAFVGGLSAGQIIWDASQRYSINPQVLLVLLRKESAGPLFADAWPLKSQFMNAMGYDCPDSGPGNSANCSTAMGGFYRQVDKAAWQLRRYYTNMHEYGYQPGRTNRIQYSPNVACGTRDVYIENYATASLYIYTPYVPNEGALNAYPGEAACGSYGNRNFFMFFREWFGSTHVNSNFLRTESNSTVYLVSGDMKYPVADGGLISAASPLGGVGYVSQSYLDSKKTGSTLGRLLRGPDGTVYFYDAGIKLHFTSCAMVANYGYNCGDSALLTQAQINRFTRGPGMVSGLGTTNGKRFYVVDGERREVYDELSLTVAGLPRSFNVLTEGVIAYLPYGRPIVRDDVYIRSRQNATQTFVSQRGAVYRVERNGVYDTQIRNLSLPLLDDRSIDKVVDNKMTMGSVIQSESGDKYLITKDGKKKIVIPSDVTSPAFVMSDALIVKVPGSGSLSNPILVKTPNDATVYAVVGGEKRPLVSMGDLLSITGQREPYIATVGDLYAKSLKTGNIIIGAGRLVKTPNDATVYTSDGYDKLIPMSSFIPAEDLGLVMSIRTVSTEILSKYNIQSSKRLTPYITCGGETYLGMSGGVYKIRLDGKVALALEPPTCNTLVLRGEAPRFLHGPDGTIYERIGDTIYPISSMARYLALKSAQDETLKVNRNTVAQFKIGPIK